jgi:hypothetical protein
MEPAVSAKNSNESDSNIFFAKIGGDSLVCPSSRADSPQSAVFGIVDNRGAFPIIRYLERPVPATAEILALTEGEDPSQVFRFTSPCQNGRCGHFRDGECGLPRFLQNHLPAAETKPVPCAIRSTCRWFHQLSFDACARCSAIVTSEYAIVGDQSSGTLEGHMPPELPSRLETASNLIKEE